jgi:hypothetical protein
VSTMAQTPSALSRAEEVKKAVEATKVIELPLGGKDLIKALVCNSGSHDDTPLSTYLSVQADRLDY